MANNQELDFSIIIACYNPDIEKLKKTIISCYKQKNVNFEIIISDDGSQNSYKQELEEWAKKIDKKLIYNFLPSNQGTIKNIISAINISKGMFIKPISPGDYFSEDLVLYEYLKVFNEKEADLIFSDAYFYNKNKVYKNLKMPFFKSTITKKQQKHICLFFDNFLGATEAFKREYVEFLKDIQEYMRLVEDLPMVYLSILNKKKIVYIDKKFFWYEYGLSLSSSTQRLKDLEGFLKYLHLYYKDNLCVLNTLKRWQIMNIKSRVIRVVCFAFRYPDLFFKNLLRKVKRIKESEINQELTNQLQYITTITEG